MSRRETGMATAEQDRLRPAPAAAGSAAPRTGLSVSVIVPVRNEESSIRGVLDALLTQTLPAHEVIIADAGSVDGTKDIVREFIRAGHPVRLVEDADAFPGRA